MNTLLFAMLLSLSVTAPPHQLLKVAKWKADALPAGTKLVQGEDGAEILEIANTNSSPLHLELLRIEKPAISAQVYTLSGKMKYENVEGAGFLELWSVFPPTHPGDAEARYFS